MQPVEVEVGVKPEDPPPVPELPHGGDVLDDQSMYEPSLSGDLPAVGDLGDVPM